MGDEITLSDISEQLSSAGATLHSIQFSANRSAEATSRVGSDTLVVADHLFWLKIIGTAILIRLERSQRQAAKHQRYDDRHACDYFRVTQPAGGLKGEVYEVNSVPFLEVKVGAILLKSFGGVSQPLLFEPTRNRK